MVKQSVYIFTLAILLISSLFSTTSAEASTLVKGTFVNVAYEDVVLSDETIEKRLKTITIKNAKGKTTTLNIDRFTKLTVNTVSTTIDAFKLGMEIEADVHLRKVRSLRGKSTSSPAAIEVGDKILTGTINRIDENGKFISVRMDDGKTKTFYINRSSEIYKGTTLVDLSVLYEGDRVKLQFSEYNSIFIKKLEVNTQGVQIEHLYKGTIQRIDPIQNKLIVKDEKVFRDWKWDSTIPNGITSHSYSTKTPIYVGDTPIEKNQLRDYTNNEIYYVTIKHFGKEIIEKMVIKRMNERTFYEPMTSINKTYQLLGLKRAGLIPYHDGTILIRNGRLVDANSLQYFGTASVITDGAQKSEYANVVHATNDGFQSPNLSSQTLYYGQISTTGSYQLTLKNAKKLTNNYWTGVTIPTLSFSNDSNVVRDFKSSVLKVMPKDEFVDYKDDYGYFYVSNNQIVAAHIIGTNMNPAKIVSVGRLTSVRTDGPDILQVQNASQWQDGYWKESGQIYSMNIEQATIIRDGKVISSDDLQANDRLFILNESIVKGRIILVD